MHCLHPPIVLPQILHPQRWFVVHELLLHSHCHAQHRATKSQLHPVHLPAPGWEWPCIQSISELLPHQSAWHLDICPKLLIGMPQMMSAHLGLQSLCWCECLAWQLPHTVDQIHHGRPYTCASRRLHPALMVLQLPARSWPQIELVCHLAPQWSLGETCCCSSWLEPFVPTVVVGVFSL